MPWVFNKAAKRYQNTDNGQFLSNERALELVDQSLTHSGNRALRLSELVANNELSPIDWRNRFRQEMKEEYIRQSIFGRGGRDRMTQADWGAIGRRLQDQYTMLDDITARIAEGEFSEGQIKVIQDNFIHSARQVYERSKSASQGIPVSELPDMPASGNQICVSNCNCFWTYNELEDAWECFWNLQTGSKHCATCLDNNAKWFPFIILKAEEQD